MCEMDIFVYFHLKSLNLSNYLYIFFKRKKSEFDNLIWKCAAMRPDEPIFFLVLFTCFSLSMASLALKLASCLTPFSQPNYWSEARLFLNIILFCLKLKRLRSISFRSDIFMYFSDALQPRVADSTGILLVSIVADSFDKQFNLGIHTFFNKYFITFYSVHFLFIFYILQWP